MVKVRKGAGICKGKMKISTEKCFSVKGVGLNGGGAF